MAVLIEKFMLVGLQDSYDAMASHDENKLYFCSDTRNIYKGDDLYTDGVRKVTVRPTKPATGVLYLVTGSGTLEMYDGTEWTVIKPKTVTAISSTSTDDQIPTAKSVYDYVTNMLEDLTGSGSVVTDVAASDTVAAVKVTKNGTDTDVVVKGVVTEPTFDPTTRKITLPVTGKDEPIVIELGKDTFLDSTKDNKYNTETGNIDLYLNDGTKIEIPAEALVDAYTGGTTNTATVHVSDTNVITVDVKLSSKEGNGITIDEDGGLHVDLSGYVTQEDFDTEVDAINDSITNVENSVTELGDKIDILNGDKTTDGSVAKAVYDAETKINVDIKKLQDDVQELQDAFGFGTF